MRTFVCLAAALLLSACASGPRPTPPAEPLVQHLVSEDAHVRIDELRVRGLTQRLTVQRKDDGVPAYEILLPPGGQDPSRVRDAAGQRVWPLLAF